MGAHQQQSQLMQSVTGGQQPHSHHHHYHHKQHQVNPNVRYTTSAQNNNNIAGGHGQIQVNAVMHQQNYSSPDGLMTGDMMSGDVVGGGGGGLIDHMPMYSNLSQSRDALNENSTSGNPLMGATTSSVDPQLPFNNNNNSNANLDQGASSFNVASSSQVVKQPVTKTNSDGGGSASARDASQDMSRLYSSRDGKYNSRGQRLHRTIPRHFTTSISSGMGESNAGASSSATPTASSSSSKKDPRDQQQQTLRRNKSEKALSGQHQQNKKPVCQCPIQHVPMTYMGSTTLSSNQLLASNVTGPTKLTSNHHHKSMLNVAKLTQQQQQQQSMVLEPAKGYDDELKLMTNSLRRIKTKLPEGHHLQGKCSNNHNHMNSVAASSDSIVKIPTISKQVLNSDKEKTLMDGQQQQRVHDHPIQSILKHTPVPSKRSTIVPGSTEADLINPPPFPIEMIDSLSVSQQQQTSHGGGGAAGGGTSVTSAGSSSTADQNPALPPKMYKANRSSHHGPIHGNIHTISKSPRMSFPQSATPSAVAMPRVARMDVFPKSCEKPQLSSKLLSTSSFPSSVNHITYSLPKANSSAATPAASSSSGTASQPNTKSSSSTGRPTISEVVSKVPSVVTVPAPPLGYQSKPSVPTQKTSTPLQPQPGCSKSVGESHYNHQQNYHPSNPQQPKTPAKQLPPAHHQHAGTSSTGAAAGVTEKPLPVCTTSKNCSNPKEHFMPNEASLEDDCDYLSECENCKSVFGSRYYLEEQVPESPQETMTLQRKPEATEGEDQTYYRASSTLPTNTKQKNT